MVSGDYLQTLPGLTRGLAREPGPQQGLVALHRPEAQKLQQGGINVRKPLQGKAEEKGKCRQERDSSQRPEAKRP